MSAYEKPMIHVVPEQAEGIFMASGDKTVCRFGRTEANPGADTCQAVLNPAVRLLSLPKAHSVLIITDVLTICRKSRRTSDADKYFGIFTSYNS